MKLSVKSLSFAYKKKELSTNPTLKNINIDISDGECVILLGQNGAGKSTLIKLLANLTNKYVGEILLDDKNIKLYSRDELAKSIAYVEQSISFEKINVLDAILLGRLPFFGSIVKEEDLEVVHIIIKELGLESLANKDVDEISVGERQKVGIARAFAQNPKILILDEPLNNLDMKASMDVVSFIKKAKEKGITTIVSMHDINTSMLFGDKFIFFKNKTIYEMGNKNIITEKLIQDIYGVSVHIYDNHIHIIGGSHS